MNTHILAIITLIAFLAQSCKEKETLSDAYGNFEAEPVMVSAQNHGQLLQFSVVEGGEVAEGEIVGIIDTMQLHLKMEQLKSAYSVSATRIRTIEAQVKAQQVQIDNLEREYHRMRKLAEDGAATEQQIDELEGNISLAKAQKHSMESQKATIYSEQRGIEVQLSQVEDQIRKSMVINPVEGTILEKYKRKGEITAPGQVLYKVASLQNLHLRAYISGNQLSSVKLGQQVKVRIDGSEGIFELPGKVLWIASEAEFTPKVIQTREERVNLVYAIKIEVKNDGQLKIGMPGEVIL